MPRSNIHGGKHHKKGKKHKVVTEIKNDRINYAGNNQVYGLVKRKLGGSRIDIECSDGKNRSAIIPGKFFKKIWINPGDILLCDLNVSNDDSLCYIVHKYSYKDANILKSQGKITFEITEDKEAQGFKFIDNNQRMILPQRNIPDINNIGSDNSSDEEINNINKKNINNNDSDDSNDNDHDIDDKNINLEDL